MLACARIGAVHSVVFAGFSSDVSMARLASGTLEWQSELGDKHAVFVHLSASRFDNSPVANS